MEKAQVKKERGILIILINILVMIIVSVLLLIGTFKWMESYTLHGQYIKVPDIKGMYEEEAAQALSKPA